MAGAAIRHLVRGAVLIGALAGCVEEGGPFAAQPKAGAAAQPASKPATSVRLVDRDVEAPEAFQTTDTALWDGRPSLGGVWVASATAKDPERVILRNPANGKFVIGALFHRAQANPGPALQISSDAAAALGLQAGQPGRINVTALRREDAAPRADAARPLLDASETVVGETPVSDGKPALATGAQPVAGGPIAVAPLDKAPSTLAVAEPASVPGGAHVVQIGIFSIEANARRAADALGKAGVAAKIRPGQTQGKAHWSVTASGGDRTALLAQVKSLGFTDAYFLSK
ncbi:MAG: SPOR domain-containing protein [Gemmobacter sp.]|jgi:hypothetical protein|nr:SPOR domain-containing protein [Gemmobacter sp.]